MASGKYGFQRQVASQVWTIISSWRVLGAFTFGATVVGAVRRYLPFQTGPGMLRSHRDGAEVYLDGRFHTHLSLPPTTMKGVRHLLHTLHMLHTH